MNADLAGRGIQDALVGLMGHEPVDVGGGNIVGAEREVDGVGHIRDRMTEDFAAFHTQVAGRHRLRRAAVDVEQIVMAAVGEQMCG